MPEQATNVRWRDGSIYQSVPTDTTGSAPYEAMFPWFNWMVAEVNFDRFKATGMTAHVDAGGPVVPGEPLNEAYGPRTETGPVLLEAFQQDRTGFGTRTIGFIERFTRDDGAAGIHMRGHTRGLEAIEVNFGHHPVKPGEHCLVRRRTRGIGRHGLIDRTIAPTHVGGLFGHAPFTRLPHPA